MATKQQLIEALRDLANAFVNPADGGRYEKGEVPVLDKARALLESEKPKPEPMKKADSRAPYVHEGKTFYPYPVNFTTGERVTYNSFPVKEKRALPAVKKEAKEKWANRQVPDWFMTFPPYLAGLEVLRQAYQHG